MASTIITKNSSTASTQPTAGDLVQGELAVNVTDRRLYTKDATGAVVELGAGTAIIYRDNFTGDGVTTAFTLPRAPLNEELVDVYIDGIYQNKDTWSLSGATLTFSEAPTAPVSGTNNIEVMTFQSAPIGETDANLVSYTPAGTGAVATNVQSKLREFPTLADYASTAQAIAAAVAGDYVVGVLDDVTVQIPSDAATLQIAVDRLTPLNKQCTITLNIQAGNVIPMGSGSNGLLIYGRDCSQFKITCSDAEVGLAASFGNVFSAYDGARLPRLSCLINASNQVAGNGIRMEGGCSVVVDPGCGVKNCWGNGLYAYRGSMARADGGIFTGCARSGTSAAGISSWASVVSAEGADCSNSGYYGAQAAHGGLLAFRLSNASNAYRHGIRATDAATVDADGATANNCGADNLGSNVRAYEGGIVNFVNGVANGNLGTGTGAAGLFAFGAGSAINARLASSTGNANYGVWAEGGAVVNTVGGSISGTTGAFLNRDSTIVRATIGDTNGVYTPTVTPVTNISVPASPTAGTACQWIRVGNTVTVSGQVTGITMTAAAAASTVLRLSLPIPSAMAASRQVGGTGVFYSSASRGTSVAIFANSTDDVAEFNWAAPTTTASQAFTFSFTYQIL